MKPTEWLDLVWESDLPSNAKLIAAYLRKFLHNNKQTCYPSKSRMIEETGLTRKTIIKYVNVLVNKGWIDLDKSNGGRNNRYTIKSPIIGIGQISTLNRVKKDPINRVKTYPLKTNKKPNKNQYYKKGKDYNSLNNLLDKSWAEKL